MTASLQWVLLLVATTGLAGIAPVFAEDDMGRVVENVRKVCEAPSERGKYWEVKGVGEGGANVRVRLIGISAEKSTVEFSQGEWEGVQQVLKEHRATDKASYRKCAETLTPIFLAHLRASKPTPRPRWPATIHYGGTFGFGTGDLDPGHSFPFHTHKCRRSHGSHIHSCNLDNQGRLTAVITNCHEDTRVGPPTATSCSEVFDDWTKVRAICCFDGHDPHEVYGR